MRTSGQAVADCLPDGDEDLRLINRLLGSGVHQDAGAELSITIEVSSGAGVSAEVLDQPIVEGFELLGIAVNWEPEI